MSERHDAIPSTVHSDVTPIVADVNIHRLLQKMDEREERWVAAQAAESQAQAERQREEMDRRERRFNRIIAVLVSVVPLLTGGGVAGATALSLGERVDDTERQLHQLGKNQARLEVQQVKSVQYIEDMLHRALPATSAVDKPEVLRAAEERVDDREVTRRVEAMLSEPLDLDDPLKDTGEPP